MKELGASKPTKQKAEKRVVAARRISFHGAVPHKVIKTKPLTRAKIEAKVAKKVDEFVDDEILQDERDERHGIKDKAKEIRMSRFNLYLELFNTVIINNMESLECVPNLSLFWDNPWGELVTLNVKCYQA